MRPGAWVVVLSLVLPNHSAAQQQGPIEKPRLIISESAVANTRQDPSPSPQRDSLKNGAQIGAFVGALLMGGLGFYVCNYQVPDFDNDSSCVKGTGISAVVGAGIGGLIGAGIDQKITKDERRFWVVKIPLRK